MNGELGIFFHLHTNIRLSGSCQAVPGMFRSTGFDQLHSQTCEHIDREQLQSRCSFHFLPYRFEVLVPF